MSAPPARGIDVEIESGAKGELARVRVRFGPHHVVEIARSGECTTFELVYTHHGFRVDASGLPSELERIIEEIRTAHPDRAVD